MKAKDTLLISGTVFAVLMGAGMVALYIIDRSEQKAQEASKNSSKQRRQR